jgi:hypothetical protein
MTWPPRRWPSCHGKSLEAQRPSTMPCGAPRPMSQGAPWARSLSATRPPPLAPLQTPLALVGQVLAARTDGGGLHAATRRYRGSQKRIERWPECLRGVNTPPPVRLDASVSAAAHCRRGAVPQRAEAGGPGRVPRMERGVAGAGAPFAVGQALGTASTQEGEKSPGALGAGHRANGCADAAARRGEAVGESLVGAVESRPAPRHSRPKKPWPKGVTVRRKPQGAQRQNRGPTRPTAHAPSPAPPDTAQSLAPPEMPAPHRDACHTSRRRRWAASRRRTTRDAKHPGRRPDRCEVSGMVHHGVRGPVPTRQVPAGA